MITRNDITDIALVTNIVLSRIGEPRPSAQSAKDNHFTSANINKDVPQRQAHCSLVDLLLKRETGLVSKHMADAAL